MIKTTFGALAAALPALSALLEEKLPITVAVKVSLMTKRFNAEMEVFNERRKALFDEFGEAVENGNLAIPEKNVAAFVPKLEELRGVPAELSIDPLQLDALGNVSITAQHVILLQEAGLLA